jgi:hypothetical protein
MLGATAIEVVPFTVEPLSFKGDGFRLTDIELITEPVRERRLSETIAAYRSPAP